MPDITGLELCDKFPKSLEAAVIFVSAHMRYQPMVDKKYPALLISKTSVQASFDDAIRAYKARLDSLHPFEFSENGRGIRIPCKDIYYITMCDHHLMINTNRGCHNVPAYRGLKEMGQSFADQGLYSCHKSYLINLRFYHTSDCRSVSLNCDGKIVKIPLSRGKEAALKAAYLNYMLGDGYAY
jgi:DNA-binding LytR/AlgR family response regulator